MTNLSKIMAALLVLLALMLGIYAWFLGQQPSPQALAAAAQPSAIQYPVVVSVRSLPAGQAIKAEDLKVQQLPVNPAGAFSDPAAVAGKVPVFDLGVGTPVLAQQLASGLANKLAEGERAMAIRVDEVIGVGHRVQPGDFVDVFVVMKKDNAEIDRSQARLLLARKRVLAYGPTSLDNLGSNTAGTAGGNARPDAARTAVLAIAVDEVNRLALLDAQARLLLALRNPQDKAEAQSRVQAGVALAELSASTRRPAPAVPSAVKPVRGVAHSGLAVEVIRGSKQDQVTN